MFLTCGMLRSWGRAWRHQGSRFLLGPPQLSCCCAVGAEIHWDQLGLEQGLCLRGACLERAARYLCCTSSLTFLEEPQGARDGLKGMFQDSVGAFV